MSNSSEYRYDQNKVKYCIDCGWFTSDEISANASSSRAAIAHFIETGHTIESVDTVPPPPLATRR